MHYARTGAHGDWTHFCSMCGPKFCSIRITQEVREYAKSLDVSDEQALADGMQTMSGTIKKTGSEIYIPIVPASRTAMDKA